VDKAKVVSAPEEAGSAVADCLSILSPGSKHVGVQSVYWEAFLVKLWHVTLLPCILVLNVSLWFHPLLACGALYIG
jgi:hypothetical protein